MAGVLLLIALSAARVTEATTQLSFEPPPQTPCVYLPEPALAEGCVELSREKVLFFAGPGAWFFATSIDGAVAVIGKALPYAGATRASARDVDAMVAGVAQSLGKSRQVEAVAQGPHVFQRVEYGHLAMASYEIAATDPGVQIRHRGYLIPVGATMVSIMVRTESEPPVAALEMVRTVQALPGAETESSSFGEEAFAWSFGLARSPFMLGLFVGVAAIIAYRLSRKLSGG